ncbi:MAG: putative agarase [Phycisphaerales bacterium]|nr:putative agarase [Phycisphaerales bacterium]
MSRRSASSCIYHLAATALLVVTPALAVAQAVPVGSPAAFPTTAPVSLSAESRFALLRGQSGFWRIGKTHEGVWWFVDPDGRPDFLNMVTTVQPTLRGRDANGPDFVSRDYDEHDPASIDRWAKAAVLRLRDVGFKGVGAWSNAALHQCDVPMTQDLNLSSWTHGGARLLYSPAWAPMIENAVKTQTHSLKENRSLVGYFLDNEMNWDDESVGPGVYFDGLSPADPNRREVVAVLRGTWASPEEFNKDWNTQIGDWSAIETWKSLPRGPARAYERLAGSWLGHLAETYFRTTTTLLRKYDPNHLVLGIRYRGSAPREVVRASRGFTDVQSLNYYVSDAKLDPETFRTISKESGQPLLISEYSFHALDGRSGNRNTIGFDAQVLDQQARGDAYRLFTGRLARVPFVIGADWFQWMDEPPSGRRSDGEDANFGVVDVDDKPYEPLASAVRSTAALLNGMHENSNADKQEDVWRDAFATKPTFHVPLLEKPIKINGELADWPAACKLTGIRPTLALGTERQHLPEPNVYVGWSAQGVSLAFEVFDSDVSAAPASGWWWARDNVEFWLSTHPVPDGQARYDAGCHHFFFVPVDFPAAQGASGVVGQWHSPGDGLSENLVPHPDIKSVTRILPDRYVTEIFIPAKSLHGYDPVHQPELAFNIQVRNYQHASEFFWSAPKQILTQARPATWGTLYLSQPSLAPELHPQPVADIK